MKNENIIMITMLGIIIILILLIKFPIQISVTYTDCPEVICQETVCKTEITYLNKTEWVWKLPDDWNTRTINISQYYESKFNQRLIDNNFNTFNIST